MHSRFFFACYHRFVHPVALKEAPEIQSLFAFCISDWLKQLTQIQKALLTGGSLKATVEDSACVRMGTKWNLTCSGWRCFTRKGHQPALQCCVFPWGVSPSLLGVWEVTVIMQAAAENSSSLQPPCSRHCWSYSAPAKGVSTQLQCVW